MDIIQRIRSTTKALFIQLELHGQLARVEWAEEKIHFQHLLFMVLLAFACLLCLLMSVSILVIALTWATDFRIAAITAMIIFYAVSLALCSYRLSRLLARKNGTFSATCEEIAADIALIRNQL